MYIVQCTLYNVHCTMYIEHYTMFNNTYILNTLCKLYGETLYNEIMTSYILITLNILIYNLIAFL